MILHPSSTCRQLLNQMVFFFFSFLSPSLFLPPIFPSVFSFADLNDISFIMTCRVLTAKIRLQRWVCQVCLIFLSSKTGSIINPDAETNKAANRTTTYSATQTVSKEFPYHQASSKKKTLPKQTSPSGHTGTGKIILSLQALLFFWLTSLA